MGQILPLWALLGSFFRVSWGVLEASGAVLGTSWASWSDLSATRGPLGPSWGSLGASWGPRGPLWGPLSPHGAFGPGRPDPPLQIDRTGLPGEGFGEGEASHTPMIPKGSADSHCLYKAARDGRIIRRDWDGNRQADLYAQKRGQNHSELLTTTCCLFRAYMSSLSGSPDMRLSNKPRSATPTFTTMLGMSG